MQENLICTSHPHISIIWLEKIPYCGSGYCHKDWSLNVLCWRSWRQEKNKIKFCCCYQGIRGVRQGYRQDDKSRVDLSTPQCTRHDRAEVQVTVIDPPTGIPVKWRVTTISMNLLLSLDQQGRDLESLIGLTILLWVTKLERFLLQILGITDLNCSV